MSLNISLSHSRPWHPWVGRVLIFRCNCVYLVPFMRLSTSNNGVTLKPWSGVVQGHWKWYHLKVWLQFPICIHSNCGSIISEIKQDIGRKSRLFYIQPGLDAPVRGSSWEYCPKICYRKITKVVWLPNGEKSLRICLLVSTQYTNVTDSRRTDTARRHRQRLRRDRAAKIVSHRM